MRAITAEILNHLPMEIAAIIRATTLWLKQPIIEIRLRANQPLQIITNFNEYFLSRAGEKADSLDNSYFVSRVQLEKAFLILTRNSVYALERQLIEGFITIPGGHRVGFTGQVIVENGEIKTIKEISSLNYRLTREMLGIASGIIEKVYNRRNDYIYNTLIISPPLCGKTTLLRDLIRLISEGVPELGLSGKKVGVVDERSEIAGTYQGVAQNKIGKRTDLLDNCPKAQGMLLLLRTMSPEVIAVDEIGREEDVIAIQEAFTGGVSILTTVHGRDLSSLKARPSIRKLVDSAVYQRFIILSKKKGIGTIDRIVDQQGKGVI